MATSANQILGNWELLLDVVDRVIGGAECDGRLSRSAVEAIETLRSKEEAMAQIGDALGTHHPPLLETFYRRLRAFGALRPGVGDRVRWDVAGMLSMCKALKGPIGKAHVVGASEEDLLATARAWAHWLDLMPPADHDKPRRPLVPSDGALDEALGSDPPLLVEGFWIKQVALRYLTKASAGWPRQGDRVFKQQLARMAKGDRPLPRKRSPEHLMAIAEMAGLVLHGRNGYTMLPQNARRAADILAAWLPISGLLAPDDVREILLDKAYNTKGQILDLGAGKGRSNESLLRDILATELRRRGLT